MKLLKVVLLHISLVCISFAARGLDKDVYIFIKDINLVQCTVSGDPVTPAGSATMQRGWKFEISGETEQHWIITIFEWSDDDSLKVNTNGVVLNESKNERFVYNEDESHKYFRIGKLEFDKVSQKISGPWFVVGTLITPIKIRFGSSRRDANGVKLRDFDFVSDVNLGLTFGFKLYSSYNKNVHVYIMGGGSLTSAAIDSSTTRGLVTTPTNASALTPFGGFMFRIDDFQILAYCGADFLTRQVGESWMYQGKPWLGIGIGFSIFKGATTGKNSE